MKNNKVRQVTTGGMIAAVYVALCVIFAPISYGPIQVRIAEALTILPLFTPAAIPGLFIGCFISNILGGAVLFDMIFGSLATLIGAIGTYLLRNKSVYLAPIPPIVTNTLIIPFVLRYAYGVPDGILFLMGTIGFGEIIGCGILGIILALVVRPYAVKMFRNA